MRSSHPVRSTTLAVLHLLAALSVLLSFVACKRNETVISEKNPPPSATPAATAAPPPAPPAPSPLDVIMAKKTMADALQVASPLMVDKFGESSDGTELFALWSIKNLKWEDVAVVKDETSYARVQKDVDEERKKRLCVRGSLIQINAHKLPQGTIYAGLLSSQGGNLFHFSAVKSTGDLVQRSRARICGVVTGRYDYSNSGGGTGHAVDVVGIFDLPENKAAN